MEPDPAVRERGLAEVKAVLAAVDEAAALEPGRVEIVLVRPAV